MKKKRLFDYLARAGWKKWVQIMKLTAFLILLFVVDASASFSQSTKISVKIENGTLSEIFSKIETQSEYRFFYQNEQIRDLGKKTVDVTNKNILDVVNELLKETELSCKLVDRNIIIFPKSENPMGNVIQQSHSVSGKVTDSTGGSLPGVSVVVKETTTGTISDANGNYSLGNLPANATLQFSFVGMKTQEIVVGNKTTINVSLADETVGLEEVVAVGYGTIKKRDLTGSISQVGKENIINKPNANPAALLAGHTSGVQILSNTGTPGGAVTVRIRGNTSLNAGNDPLYIVDGVPSGDITTINPNDIESIEVLKDASASAIYGARASNGVVIITTKRGKSGTPVYEFNTYYGLQKVTKTIPYLDGEEQYQMTLKAIENYNRNNSIPNIIRPQTVLDHAAGYNTNWQDEIFRTAPIKNYDLNILKGNEDFKMAFGLNYFDQDGIIISTEYKRFSTRFNFDLKASEKVRIGATINFAKETRDKVPDGIQDATSVMGNVMRKLAYEPVYNPDGSYALRERANPVAQALESHLFDYFTKGLGNAYLEYDIVNHLTFRTMEAIDYRDIKSESFKPSYIDGGTSRPASFSGGEYITWLTENTLTYSNLFRKVHRITALLGYSAQKSKDYTYGGAGSQGSSDIIYTLNASALKTNATSYKTAWGMSSVFGRINYSLKDKYLLTLNLRQDGSSRFGESKQFAIFPALSGGWRISEEPFFKMIPYVNDLKLRGSIGRTGNQNISNYGALGLYGVGANYAGNPGIYSQNLPNTELTWETTDQYDLGMDFSIFKSRLSIGLDTYMKNTTGLLFNVPVPSTTGYSNSLQNLGKIQNKGLEISINADIIKGKYFSWSSDFNISFNRNKVLELPNHSRIITSYSQASFTDASYFLTEEGKAIGLFYGLKWTGKVYPTNEEAKADITDVNGRGNWGGNYQYEDISGPDGKPDKKISYLYDRQVIGDPNPDFVGGWNNTFRYKGFDLSCSMQFVYGNSIYNENKRMSGRFAYNAYTKDFLDAWTTPGQITTVHKVYPATDDENFGSMFIEDGSYLKVKDLTLGYNLPANISSKIKLSSFRVYISAYNLYTLTHYSGFDPDVNAQAGNVMTTGCDSGVFPQMKSLLIGINLKF